jgi:hypothetical protein
MDWGQAGDVGFPAPLQGAKKRVGVNRGYRPSAFAKATEDKPASTPGYFPAGLRLALT